MFELMRELFQVLNDARRRRGSIDFDLNETQIIMDSGGMVEAIVALERNVAHRIIEEFMLLANETVASYLEEQGAPALYRIHEEPDLAEGVEVRGIPVHLRPESRCAVDGPAAAALPETDRARERRPEEKPIAFPHAAHDAEGALLEQNNGHFDSRRPATRTSPRRFVAIRTWWCIARCGQPAKLLNEEEREVASESLPRLRGTRPRWSGVPTMPSGSCCSGRGEVRRPTRSAMTSTAT